MSCVYVYQSHSVPTGLIYVCHKKWPFPAWFRPLLIKTMQNGRLILFLWPSTPYICQKTFDSVGIHMFVIQKWPLSARFGPFCHKNLHSWSAGIAQFGLSPPRLTKFITLWPFLPKFSQKFGNPALPDVLSGQFLTFPDFGPLSPTLSRYIITFIAHVCRLAIPPAMCVLIPSAEGYQYRNKCRACVASVLLSYSCVYLINISVSLVPHPPPCGPLWPLSGPFFPKNVIICILLAFMNFCSFLAKNLVLLDPFYDFFAPFWVQFNPFIPVCNFSCQPCRGISPLLSLTSAVWSPCSICIHFPFSLGEKILWWIQYCYNFC